MSIQQLGSSNFSAPESPPQIDSVRPPQLNETVCSCRCGCGCDRSYDDYATGDSRSYSLRDVRNRSATSTSLDLGGDGESTPPNATASERPDDDGSDTASVDGHEGLESYHLEAEVQEVGDLGLHTQRSIERSIDRHQGNVCSCVGMTTGWSASPTGAEPSTGSQSMTSSGALTRVVSSSTLLEHTGGLFDEPHDSITQPLSMAQQFGTGRESALLYPTTLDILGDNFND